jgi:hypothetical protein
MMAITTSNSIRVKPDTLRLAERCMSSPPTTSKDEGQVVAF